MRTQREFHQATAPLRLLFQFTILFVLLVAAPDVSWGTITFTQRPSGTPNPVAPGGTVTLTVTAVQSLGHPLTYVWSASCVSVLGSNGSFSNPSSQTTTWTAPMNSTGSSQACTMQVRASDGQGDSDFDVYAQFVTSAGLLALTVSIIGNGSGTVATSQSPPQGINCGSGTPNTGTCTASFTSGTSVTLTATQIGSSSFDGWGGDCAFAGTALTCTLTINSPKSVTATFTQTSSFGLSVQVFGSGTVTSSPAGINCPGTCSASFTAGTTVTLLANRTASSTLQSWGGDCTGQNDLCLVTMSGPKSVVATFTQISGTITGLTVTPSVAQVGQSVIITVVGTGPCGGLALAFGDGGSTGVTGSLPLTTTHTYASAGQFTLTATGVNNCTGFASTSLVVNNLTGALTVTVQRSDTRTPLQGATVTLTQGPSNPSPQITGSDGIATFTNIVAGTYLATATLTGFQTSNATAVVNANTTTPAFILLTPVQSTGTLAVTVRRSDTSGALQGATVTLSGPSSPPSQTTGSDGTAIFTNITIGSYTATASLAGFQTNNAPATVSANTTQQVTVLLTPVQSTGTLAVTVRRSDTSGALQGATVTLSGPSSPPSQTTGSDGTAIFTNITIGSYTATASLAGFQTNNAPATVSANTTQQVTLSLIALLGNAGIRVILDGAPWHNGTLTFDANTPAGFYANIQVTPPQDMSNLPAGPYTITYQAGGPPGAILQSITPSATPTLAPGATVLVTFNFTSLPTTLDPAPLIDALQGVRSELINAIDRHTTKTALVYASAAQVRADRGLTDWFKAALDAANHVIVDILGTILDLKQNISTLEAGVDVIKDPTKLQQLWNGLKTAKKLLTTTELVAGLYGFYQDWGDYDLFQTVFDQLSVQTETTYKASGFNAAQDSVALVLHGSDPTIASPLHVPERSGPRIPGSRYSDFQWLRGTHSVIMDINAKFNTLLNVIPPSLPTTFPLTATVNYLNTLRTTLITSQEHITSVHFFASQDATTIDTRAVALGLVVSDVNQLAPLQAAISNGLDAEYKETWLETANTVLGLTDAYTSTLGIDNTFYDSIRVASDAINMVDSIAHIPEQSVEIVYGTVKPQDVLNNLAMQIVSDLQTEVTRLWVIADGVAGVPDQVSAGKINGGFLRYLLNGGSFPK